MINFLHLSALLSLTLALCLQRNAKKMNGANISPSFYSFFIFFSIFVFILLLLPPFPFFLPFFLLSFLSFFLSSFLSFFLSSFLSFFLSYSILFFFLLFFSFVCSSCLYLCFALSFLVFLFSFLLFCSSFSVPPFSVPPFSVPPFSEECDLQQKFHIDNVKHLPKLYAHFLKARFLFET